MSMLLDVSRLTGRLGSGRLPTGVDRVVLAYIERWGGRSQAVLQAGSWRRILPVRESQRLFRLLTAPPIDFRRQLISTIARACVPPWPSQDAASRISFSLSHSGIERPGLRDWLIRTRQRPVFFVHDLIPIVHPEFCRAGEARRHAARMTNLLSVGAGLVCNSESTFQSLRQFAAARGLEMPETVVASLAPPELPDTAGTTSPLAVPYFVILGTIEARKNHLLLLHLWREMAATAGPDMPHLVIIGQRGWECENVIDMLERCDALQGVVHELSDCADAELARYLRHARALLFPSFAEGYGLPLMEAFALGTPVIASDLPVFREIARDVPEYVNSLDGPGWLAAVHDYAKETSGRRSAQLERMAAFAVPTWADHFSRVQNLLERLHAPDR
jgi:glycosyltransferase involved in cell wall biosynthesis